MAPILTIFGPNRSQRRNLFFEKFSNERRRHRGIVVVVIVAVVVAVVVVIGRFWVACIKGTSLLAGARTVGHHHFSSLGRWNPETLLPLVSGVYCLLFRNGHGGWLLIHGWARSTTSRLPLAHPSGIKKAPQLNFLGKFCRQKSLLKFWPMGGQKKV